MLLFLNNFSSFCADKNILNNGAAPFYDLQLNTSLLLAKIQRPLGCRRILTPSGSSVDHTEG
jgi:hypothetical protein